MCPACASCLGMLTWDCMLQPYHCTICTFSSYFFLYAGCWPAARCLHRRESDSSPFLAARMAAAVELRALGTLAAALMAVPAAFRSNMALLEHFVCDRLCAQSSSASLRLAASHCLSLLPSVTGIQWSPCSMLMASSSKGLVNDGPCWVHCVLQPIGFVVIHLKPMVIYILSRDVCRLQVSRSTGATQLTTWLQACTLCWMPPPWGCRTQPCTGMLCLPHDLIDLLYWSRH